MVLLSFNSIKFLGSSGIYMQCCSLSGAVASSKLMSSSVIGSPKIINAFYQYPKLGDRTSPFNNPVKSQMSEIYPILLFSFKGRRHLLRSLDGSQVMLETLCGVSASLMLQVAPVDFLLLFSETFRHPKFSH